MCETAEKAAVSAQTLLAWYDRHGRDLPWRVRPQARAEGVIADPYRIWLSEVMLQQTTVAAVKSYFLNFTTQWPCIHDLAEAEDGDVMAAWAGLGYYARARNLLKCARIVSRDLGGDFPRDRAGLQALPGIGPYTSAAIAAIAYDAPETVVDGNVERVMARLHAVETPLPEAKGALTELASQLTPKQRAGDYAQAVMDLGATICTPRNPACGICPWRDPCSARKSGLAADLPRKSPKAVKPTRFGVMYLGQRADGAILLERRPDKGLLGGMLGWPGSDWVEGAAPETAPPVTADWQELPGEVRHTFTHFHLRAKIQVARLPQSAQPQTGQFIEWAEFSADDLPTVMRKAYRLWHKSDAFEEPAKS